jgi:hypothetical protein
MVVRLLISLIKPLRCPEIGASKSTPSAGVQSSALKIAMLKVVLSQIS